MPEREKIALCLEYPIEQFGGTEVLVRQLVHGLAERYRIVLVSPDDGNDLKSSSVAGKVEQHLFWNPARITAASSRRLARRLPQAASASRIFISREITAGATVIWAAARFCS